MDKETQLEEENRILAEIDAEREEQAEIERNKAIADDIAREAELEAEEQEREQIEQLQRMAGEEDV